MQYYRNPAGGCQYFYLAFFHLVSKTWISLSLSNSFLTAYIRKDNFTYQDNKYAESEYLLTDFLFFCIMDFDNWISESPLDFGVFVETASFKFRRTLETVPQVGALLACLLKALAGLDGACFGGAPFFMG